MNVSALMNYGRQRSFAAQVLIGGRPQPLDVSALAALGDGGTVVPPGNYLLAGSGGTGGIYLPTPAQVSGLEDGDTAMLMNASGRTVSIRALRKDTTSSVITNAQSVSRNRANAYEFRNGQWRQLVGIGYLANAADLRGARVGFGFSQALRCARAAQIIDEIPSGSDVIQTIAPVVIVEPDGAGTIHLRLAPASEVGDCRSVGSTPLGHAVTYTIYPPPGDTFIDGATSVDWSNTSFATMHVFTMVEPGKWAYPNAL